MESCSSCTLFLSLNQITFILPVKATLLCTFSTAINNSSEPTEISSYVCILKKVLSKFRLSKCHLNPLLHTKVDSWCPMDVNRWISVYKPDLSCFYAFCKEIECEWALLLCLQESWGKRSFCALCYVIIPGDLKKREWKNQCPNPAGSLPVLCVLCSVAHLLVLPTCISKMALLPEMSATTCFAFAHHTIQMDTSVRSRISPNNCYN